MTGPRQSRGPYLNLRDGRNARERMRELREKAELTQAQLAEKAGRSTAWVAIREQGRRRMSVAEAEQVAEALGTSLAGLTGGTS